VQIVLATEAFVAPGGSESYLLTVAEQFERLGHDVTVHAASLGPMAELARARGIAVTAEAEELDACDVVLAQDAGVAYTLADRFPGAPQAFVCHAAPPDRPPAAIPGVAGLVVVLDDRTERRVRALRLDADVLRLRQPIDVDDLSDLGWLPDRPERALLIDGALPADVLAEAWAAAGVKVVRGEDAPGSPELADALAAVDIVVGAGRALLEAMARGRPVYCCGPRGGEWVTAGTYPALEADGFAGPAGTAALGAAQLCEDLARCAPEMGRVNRKLALEHHSGERHAQTLAAVLRRLAPAGSAARVPTREFARLTRLRWRAEHELHVARLDAGAAVEERERATAEVTSLRAHGRALTARVEAAEGIAADLATQLTAAEERSLRELSGAQQLHVRELAAAEDRRVAELAALEERWTHELATSELLRVRAVMGAEARWEALRSQRRVRFGLALGRLADRLRPWRARPEPPAVPAPPRSAAA
jgi:hypothetical protein